MYVYIHACKKKLPLSLSRGGCFKKETGLFHTLCFFGRPITVFSAPLGLPRFFMVDGIVILLRSVAICDRIWERGLITQLS